MPMAMRIGSTSKIDEVGRDDFLALAKELDVSPRMVRRLIGEVCEGAGGAASAVASDMEDALGAPLPKYGRLKHSRRCRLVGWGVPRLGRHSLQLRERGRENDAHCRVMRIKN